MSANPISSLFNVTYDQNSSYPWEDLNEKDFLTDFFSNLKSIMGSDFLKWNFYILSSHNPDIIPQSVLEVKPNKVLFFISDESCTVPLNLSKSYDFIFKSYITQANSKLNIFPFALGCVKDVPALKGPVISEREYNIFFSGNLNKNRLPLYREFHPIFKHLPKSIALPFVHSWRKTGWPRLKDDFSTNFERSNIVFSRKFKGGLTPIEYAGYLANSKIVFCPRGFNSYETFRHMEALRAGSIVISEPLPETIFYKNSPIITVPNWKVGLRKARELLADNDRLIEIQKKSITWWEDVCSEPAVAKYVARLLSN